MNAGVNQVGGRNRSSSGQVRCEEGDDYDRAKYPYK